MLVYDDAQSAKKLYDHIQVLRAVSQSIIVSNFTHELTPPAINMATTSSNQ